MIFVTVGTHEQPFDRLIKVMDDWAERNDEEVVIQTGFSEYQPRHCKWQKLFPYEEMEKYISKARIVITHGGPSSFIMPLQIGKTPIVVPRQVEYKEHINNHQIEFCKAVANRRRTIIVVEKINMLEHTIENYNQIIRGLETGLNSNNEKFCKDLSHIIDDMFRRE